MVNFSAVLMSLMALQLKHIDRDTFKLQQQIPIPKTQEQETKASTLEMQDIHVHTEYTNTVL